MDLTEDIRKELRTAINIQSRERPALEEAFGDVWDTAQLQNDFKMRSFSAPFVVVTRKADDQEGFLTFQHYPRFYWGFEPA